MGERRGASRGASRRPASRGRDKLTTTVDSVLLANIKDLARRKNVQICELVDLAFRQIAIDDAAARTDSLLAPLVDRAIERRMKALEGGLRTMIARLAYENLTHQYVFFNFLVEANVPPGKVEKWRTDGRKFAIQEYRRKPPELNERLDEDP